MPGSNAGKTHEMNRVALPMRTASGETVELIHVLRSLPENAWTWSILDLWGTGIAPGGMAMRSFEDLISSSADGYVLSWHELVETVARLDQVHDCLILAGESQHALSEPLIAIEGQDSTRWEIHVAERLDCAGAVRERLSSINPTT